MIPGVGGDSDNMYEVELLRKLRKRFKIAILLFRGASGLPITSAKLCGPSSWEDVREGIEYVSKNYCFDPKTDQKRCRYYAYACSMGAAMLVLYLINDNLKAAKNLDGAALYGTMWDYHKGQTKYYHGYGGWPEYLVVMNLVRMTRQH
mmetsp:Transcript_9719/g.13282  ORF Transcript_9719/g.13282 Transcript_9719/m.13282 type:complete len:148 (+) Transcript_9719:377-820(+)